MLILKQSGKDSTLQKSPSDHSSEIARLTLEIAYLRNENRTKSCVIQPLLENNNTQQKPLVSNKSGFKLPNKYMCEALKINRQIIRVYLHLITTNNYQRMTIVMRSAIWYHLYKLKKRKNIHGGVLLLVKACNFTKISTLPCVFFTFFKLYK